MTDYERIKKAIEFIHSNFQQQPDLDAVAKEVYLSPFHFQRLFKDWAGVSPKKFLQYISLQHAKKLVRQHTVSDSAYETGLSGSSRLHDLFINIEGMTPGEYKTGGEQLRINYNRGRMISGTPKRMRQQIEALCAQYGVNEIVLCTISENAEERRTSFKLLAKEFGLG